MLLAMSKFLSPAMVLLFQRSESLRRTGDDAFFTGQLIGSFVISRVLLGIIEVVVLLVFVKVFKLKAYIGIVVSAVLAFLLYLLPNLLLSGPGSIPGVGPEIAEREAATTQTNIMLMGVWLVVWVAVDCGIALLVSRRAKPQTEKAANL